MSLIKQTFTIFRIQKKRTAFKYLLLWKIVSVQECCSEKYFPSLESSHFFDDILELFDDAFELFSLLNNLQKYIERRKIFIQTRLLLRKLFPMKYAERQACGMRQVEALEN